MAVGNINPDGDVVTEWVPSVPAIHFDDVDEGPSSGTDYVMCIGAAYSNKYDTFDMETIADVEEVTKIEVKINYYLGDGSNATPPAGQSIDINLGGWQIAQTLPIQSRAWRTFTWLGLSGDQEDLDALQVRVYSGVLFDGTGCVPLDDLIYAYTIYITVTYTAVAPTGWGHKFLGVSAANIAKINGIPIANIASIKGLDI